MKYYSTQRPITPGSFPHPDGNTVIEIKNFDSRIYCREIGREAWGYIEYENALPDKEAASYELIAAGTGEDKGKICKLLCKVLQMTEGAKELVSLIYNEDRDAVEVVLKDGEGSVDIEGQTALEMIKSITGCFG